MIPNVSFPSFSCEENPYFDMMILQGKTILYIRTCIFNKASIDTGIIVQMQTWFRMVFACCNGGVTKTRNGKRNGMENMKRKTK